MRWMRGQPCWYCGLPADSRDHLTAKTRGGIHQHTPIVPACTACNTWKSARTVEEFRRGLIKTIGPRKRERPNYQAIEARAFVFYGEQNPTMFTLSGVLPQGIQVHTGIVSPA